MSEICFNLSQSKIMSSGKGLRTEQIDTDSFLNPLPHNTAF